MESQNYILKKLFQALLTIFIVLILNYFLFRVLPGDPIRVLIRTPRMSTQALEQIQAQFGLNQSWYIQFLYYLRDLFQGNLGTSFAYREPVLKVILERVPPTLLLVGISTLLSIILGIIVGLVIAWKRGSKLDVIGLGISLILYSMPTFWVGIIMIMLFAVYLQIFPTGLMQLPGEYHPNLWARALSLARHMFLPVFTFSFILIGEYVLIMRNSLLEVFQEDYMTTARAKGISHVELLKRHALPNAMLPMVSLIAINLGFVVAGAIQIETVFSWPGLGGLIYSALLNRDYPLLQGLFLFITVCVIGANLCADLLYGYLDPRIKSS